MSLITTTGLKDRVNWAQSDTSMNQVFADIISGVEDWMLNQYLQRAYLLKPTTAIHEYQDGWEPWNSYAQNVHRFNELWTKEWPVTSGDVVSLTVDGEAIPLRPSVTEIGYYVDEGSRGRICVYGYPMFEGFQNIDLEYKPGYTTTSGVPASIIMAEYDICVAAWNKRGVQGFARSRVGNVLLDMKDMIDKGVITDALRMLDSHRRK